MDTSFIALIESDRVSQPTREAMISRIKEPQTNAAKCVPLSDYATLEKIVNHLIPQIKGEPGFDLAALLDHSKAAGSGNGWRYAEMPPDALSLTRGLTLIDESSRMSFGKCFAEVNDEQQLALLHRAQAGELGWSDLKCSRWFEELLADLVEIYVSHPATMAAMGFDGFAFMPRWENTGLNTAEAWEPRAK